MDFLLLCLPHPGTGAPRDREAHLPLFNPFWISWFSVCSLTKGLPAPSDPCSFQMCELPSVSEALCRCSLAPGGSAQSAPSYVTRAILISLKEQLLFPGLELTHV